jgi:hypothetical protein
MISDDEPLDDDLLHVYHEPKCTILETNGHILINESGRVTCTLRNSPDEHENMYTSM